MNYLQVVQVIVCTPLGQFSVGINSLLFGQAQVDANGILDRLHIGFADRAELAFKPGFVGSHDLVCHRLAALAIDGHDRLTRVLTARVAG